MHEDLVGFACWALWVGGGDPFGAFGAELGRTRPSGHSGHSGGSVWWKWEEPNVARHNQPNCQTSKAGHGMKDMGNREGEVKCSGQRNQ